VAKHYEKCVSGNTLLLT